MDLEYCSNLVYEYKVGKQRFCHLTIFEIFNHNCVFLKLSVELNTTAKENKEYIKHFWIEENSDFSN